MSDLAPSPITIFNIPKRTASLFRPDIEGLRGLAVLLVVLYHVGVPMFGGGFIGVDVFFVLSGYLITGLIVREIETSGRLDLLHFYARRARRLLPASALMLLIISAATAILLSPPEQVNLARSARATAAYLSNLWFTGEASNYFAPGIETNPLLHTWSLAVEEQFYAFWPLLVLFGLRGCGARRRLAVTMSALGVLSFALSVYFTAKRPVWAFYMMPLRAWEFAIGGLVCMTPARFLAPYWHRLGWAGLLTILGASGVYSRFTVFPGLSAAVPAVGTALVLVSYVAAPSLGPTLILRQPIFQWFGKLSYSWYLWHWPFLALAAALKPDLGVGWRAGLALASLCTAALTFRCIEYPIRCSKRLASRPKISLALAAVLTLVSVSLTHFWRQEASKESILPKYARFTAAKLDYSTDCLVRAGQAEVRECVFGAPDASTTVVLFGDSHADHWLPAVERLASERMWRMVTMVKSSCPAPEVLAYNRLIGGIETECTAWRAEALRRIAVLHPAAVIMASYSGYYKDPGQTKRFSYAEWKQGSRQTMATLTSAAIPAVVLLDTPWSTINAPDCLSRAAMNGWLPERACAAKLNNDIRAAERDAASAYPNISVVDLADQFCDGSLCGPIRDGMVVYRDQNHIATSYALKLAPVLGEKLSHCCPAINRRESVDWLK